MTRNALYIEAVGMRANNVLLPHSIQAWDNDCWPNKVLEEQLDQRQIPPSKLEQSCVGCWPGPTDKRAWSIHRNRPGARTVIKDNAGTLNQIVLHGWPIE